MTTANPLDAWRNEYADWYVREQLARRRLKTVRDGRAAMIIGGWQGLLEDLVGTCDVGPLVDAAEWFVAEAEYRRLRAEAILRLYGSPVI